MFFSLDQPTSLHYGKGLKTSRIRETTNLSTAAGYSTDIFVSGGVKKGAGSIFFAHPPKEIKLKNPSRLLSIWWKCPFALSKMPSYIL